MNMLDDTNSQMLIIILDGWTKQLLNSMLEDGCLSEIEDLINDGIKLDYVISNLPSISISSHLSILAGATMSEHGIPGHRWLDRKNKRIRKYLNPFVSKYLNKDINSSIGLVYKKNKHKRSIAVQEIVNRDASKVKFLPTMSSKCILNETGRQICKKGNSVVVSWLPKVDSLSHSYGPNSIQVRKEMINTSKNLGKLFNKLRAKGLYDNLRIVLVSDHGQRKVTKRAKLDLIFKQLGLEAQLNPKLYTESKQLILTSGDSFAQIYLTPDILMNRYEFANKLIKFEEIEFVCWNCNGKWHILNKIGYATAEWDDPIRHIIKYSIIKEDPLLLNLDEQVNYIDCFMPIGLSTRYPDFLHQLMVSYVEHRTGDIVVFSSKDYHFGSAPRIAFRLGFHKGTHGGPFEDEMVIPAIIKNINIKNEPIRISDILKKAYTKE